MLSNENGKSPAPSIKIQKTGAQAGFYAENSARF
jgi:hypothetical protein